MNNIQDNIDDLETDNETDIDDNNSSEIRPSSKGNKTTGLPKKRKRRRLKAEKKKKCETKYDRTNSNSTSSMNYHIIQEHDIVLESLAKKAEKKGRLRLNKL
ncbi:1237_t:CDS:2 [Dentiscutata heterogama]|uniref:1237_t:CDS:1 n=1 Tax=Dentiscutata heterogama TaxID=1316150 RepID=A0ACA9MTM7_9GLOM|nr:1237_t:CDS:2 [Dentiscutata heterogama]